MATIGGRIAAAGFHSRNIRVPTAPSKVAKVPKTTSGSGAPPTILPNKHPTVSPGTAAAVNTGKIVSASEIRTCTSLNENGANTTVSTT